MRNCSIAFREILPPENFGRFGRALVYGSAAVGAVLPTIGLRYSAFQEMSDSNDFYAWGISAGLGFIAALNSAPLFADIAKTVVETLSNRTR